MANDSETIEKTMNEQQEARAAIKAILKAAANPEHTHDQAADLVNEAMRNAEIAFGDWAGRELLEMAVDQTVAIYEHGATSLNRLSKAREEAANRAHDFGSDRHSQTNINCLSCGFEASIPEILCGRTSMWGCPGSKEAQNSP